MTSHHTTRIANALLKAISRRRVSVPHEMDGRLFADIGFSQSDIIALPHFDAGVSALRQITA